MPICKKEKVLIKLCGVQLFENSKILGFLNTYCSVLLSSLSQFELQIRQFRTPLWSEF